MSAPKDPVVGWYARRGMRSLCDALDEQAYGVFLPLGQAAGLTLKEEDFSDPGPLGMHFVRIQNIPIGWLM